MFKAFLIFTAAVFGHSSFAYSKKDFVCPLMRPELKPIIFKYHPEALKKNGRDFKFTWTKPVDQSIEAKARIQTVADLYELAKKEINNSISIFAEPNAEISSNSELVGFYQKFVDEHSPKLNRRDELKKQDAKLCRQEALEFLNPSNSLDDFPKDTTEASGTLDPLEELSIAISKTCARRNDFNQCLKQVSKATLMCVSPQKRAKMSEQVAKSYESFQKIIVSQSAKLASKSNTLKESHFQIRILLTLFPKLSEQYLGLLATRGTGISELRMYAEKIATEQPLTEEEESTLHVAVNSIAQICRVDFLMDIRETFKDVLTWSSVALTVSTLAFGPIFGVTLLPAVMNAGTTVGFLVGLNVISHVVTAIDGILMFKDVRSVFDQGKIAKVLFKIVRYQKNVMDTVITRIQHFQTSIPESELSKKDLKAARSVLLDAIKLSTEYQNLIKLYSSLKSANFNRAKTVMNLFLFALALPPTIAYDQALFNSIGIVHGTGKEALQTINSIENPSAAFSALRNTRTALTVSMTVTSLQYSLIGLSNAQIRFVKEALDSMFTIRP